MYYSWPGCTKVTIPPEVSIYISTRSDEVNPRSVSDSTKHVKLNRILTLFKSVIRPFPLYDSEEFSDSVFITFM